MDILQTYLWAEQQITDEVAATESAYPQLKTENDKIRKIMGDPEHVKKLRALEPRLDFFAAMISSCRSDMLNCGRCLLWSTVRRAREAA